jgi:hypothetical protein
MVYIKVIVVNLIYKIVVDKFFIWNDLESQMFVLISNFEI